MRRSFVLLLATLAAAVLPAAAQTSPRSGPAPSFLVAPGPKYAPDRVLVKFRAKAAASAMAAAHAAAGATVLRQFASVSNLQLVQIPVGTTVPQAVAQYRANPAVQYAEPDFSVSVVGAPVAPNDPQFPQQWDMNNTGQTGGTSGADIRAEAAWGISTGSRNVVVAVIDTGADYTHPDLSANIWSAPFAFTANSGTVSCPAGSHGFNAWALTCDPMDDATPSHGTHVSGTIGAVGNNSMGVAGVNWQVTILPCKFLNSSGSGSTSGAILCLDLVASLKDLGINIVATNNSWGGGGFSQALNDAIQAQMDRGILFVAAAGNNGSDHDLVPEFPAGINLPNVVAVAASDSNDNLAGFSDFGRHTVQLGAPGVSILSTLSGGAYGLLSGTSMAAPHVTGAIALLQAQNPTLDWRATRNLLLTGGDFKLPLANTISQRRLNVFGAMTCTPGPDRTLETRLLPMFNPTTAGVNDALTLTVLDIDCSAPAGPVTVMVNPGALTLPLADDGNAPDQAAGDGIYTSAWTPSTPGTYTVTFPNSDVVTVQALQGYSFSTPAFSYITFTGTNLNLSDDSVATVTLPFPIQFGNQGFSTLYVSSNGTISVDRPFDSPANASLPTTTAGTLIAPFWEDLMPQPGTAQNVFWTTQGTAPNRQVIIEWRNVPRFDNPVQLSETVTFEVVLNESVSDIQFNYLDTCFCGGLLFTDFGGQAASGIQIAPGSATQYSFDQQSLFSNLTVLWRAIPDFTMNVKATDGGGTATSAWAGQTATFQGTLTEVAGYNSSVSLTCVAGSTALPATCTVSPSSVTPTRAGATLSLTTGDPTAGSYDFNLQGVGSDPNTMTHLFHLGLNVMDFSITAPTPNSVSTIRGGFTASMTFQLTSSANYFAGAVNFSCTGLPAGAVCNGLIGNFLPGGNTNVTLPSFNIVTQPSTAPGTYTVHLVASASRSDLGTQTHTQDFTLIVLPDFGVSTNSNLAGAQPGQTMTGTINVTADATYSGTVNLTCKVFAFLQPAPLCGLSPTSFTTFPNTSTITISTNGADSGSYTVQVTGTDGVSTHSVGVPYSINGYHLSMFSPQYAVSGSTSLSLFYSPDGTFNGTVNATCDASAIDPAATCTVTNPLQTGSVPMTLTVPANVTFGTFPLNLTSSDTTGTFSRSASGQVIVEDFTLTHGPNTEQLAIRGAGSDPFDGEIIPVPGETASVVVNCLSSTPGTFCISPGINQYSLAQGTVLFPISFQSSLSTPVGDYTFGLRGTLFAGGSPTSAFKLAPNLFTVHVRDFSLNISPASVSTRAGDTGQFNITGTNLLRTQPVSFYCTNLAPGITCDFSPPTIMGAQTSVLTVNLSASVPAGVYTPIVNGYYPGTNGFNVLQYAFPFMTVSSAASGFHLTASPNFDVAPVGGGTASYAISVFSDQGFSNPVSLSCAGPLPAGVSCSFFPSSVTPTAGGTASTLTVSVASNLPVAANVLTLTGSSGSITATQPVTLVTGTDFSLAIPSAPQTLYLSNFPITYNGVITALGPYNSLVNLSCIPGSTAPPLCTPSPASLVPAGGGGTPVSFRITTGFFGDFNFKLHAVGIDPYDTTHDVPVTLHVIDFYFAYPNPAAVTIPHGTSQSVSSLITAVGPFTDTVSLSCGGLPAGMSCSASPNNFTPATGAGTPVTVTVSTQPTLPTGTYSLTLLAKGNLPNAPTKTNPLTVAVTTNVDFFLGSSASLVSRIGQTGVSGAAGILYLDGYSNPVNLGCSVSPAGPSNCGVTPSSVSASDAALSVSVDAGTGAAGNYQITLTGTDGVSKTHSITIPYAIWDYSVVAPGSASTITAVTRNIPFTLHPLNGQQNVDVSCLLTNIPGATCTLLQGGNPVANPVSLAGGDVNLTAALTLAAGANPCGGGAGCTLTIHTVDHDVPTTPAHDAAVNIFPPVTASNDFNADGDADILWQNSSSGDVVAWLMNGAAKTSSGVVASGVDLNWKAVGVGDFDGDGHADVLWQNSSSGGVVVWLMNGASRTSSTMVASGVDPNWKVVGVGDFDGDGHADILWQNSATGDVAVWLMNGASRTSTGVVASGVDLHWKVVGVGDFDGDGHADILWQNSATGDVVVWLMNGASRTSSAVVASGVDLNWKAVGVGDFDADGKADILWQNSATGGVVVWLMNGASRTSSATVATGVDPNWKAVGVADYSGDGMADILWQNSSTGDVVVWLMNGASRTSSATVASGVDPNWRVVAKP